MMLPQVLASLSSTANMNHYSMSIWSLLEYHSNLYHPRGNVGQASISCLTTSHGHVQIVPWYIDVDPALEPR